MGGVDVVRVDDAKTLRQFVDLPYWLHRDDRYWVPPLRIAQKELLNQRKHPFYAHAEMQCFVARKEGRTVGRVAAIVDHNYNEFQREEGGAFGFFESVDDFEVASGLMQAARAWLVERGAKVIRGPFNPSTNYECGMLVEGFDSSPYVMMTHNPRYYPALMERLGLRKAKDLLAYARRVSDVTLEKAERVANKALEMNRVKVRPIRMKAFQEDVELVWKVYNAAWERNWGFVPMTREEFLHEAAEMRQILVPDLVLLGEVRGQVVGFALALPDINQALRHAGGRLFPWGLLKILYYQRKIRNIRVVALGVVEEFRATGVAAGFYAELNRNARRLGYVEAEMSWILEDNALMNRSLKAMGARHYKTYRIYEWN